MDSTHAVAEPVVRPPLPTQVAEGQARNLRDWHYAMLAITITIVVLSLILSVRDDQRIIITGLSGYPIPETCWMKNLFHCDCPGCGLTRSFVHLAHGNWRQSLAVHRIGWLLAIAFLVQIPYRWIVLRNPAWTVGSRWSKGIFIFFVVALIVNWLINLAIGFRT